MRLDAIKSELKHKKGRGKRGAKKDVRGPWAARHALDAVRRVFAWAEDGHRFGVQVSPAAGLTSETVGLSAKAMKRRRALDDDELRRVWQAAGDMGPFGVGVRVLMLTGARRDDIFAARWDEMKEGFDADEAMLAVPPERFKSDEPFEVMLGPKAVELLNSLPRFKSCPFIFTNDGHRMLSSFSKPKAKLDEKSKVMGSDSARFASRGALAAEADGHQPRNLRAGAGPRLARARQYLRRRLLAAREARGAHSLGAHASRDCRTWHRHGAGRAGGVSFDFAGPPSIDEVNERVLAEWLELDRWLWEETGLAAYLFDALYLSLGAGKLPPDWCLEAVRPRLRNLAALDLNRNNKRSDVLHALEVTPADFNRAYRLHEAFAGPRGYVEKRQRERDQQDVRDIWAGGGRYKTKRAKTKRARSGTD